MSEKRTWRELSPLQQRAIIVAGAAEIILTSSAAFSLLHRSPEQVRGPRLAWAAALPIQPFGPIAYFAWGRK